MGALSHYFVTGLFVMMSTVGCATVPNGGDPKEAISKVLTAQAAAWNRGDIDAFMDGYERSEALLFTSGGKVRRGFDETIAKYRASYGDPGAMGHLDFEIKDVRLVGNEGAVVLGSWMLTGTPKAGGGLFTLVFVRTPAGWKVVHDHTSLDPDTRPKEAAPSQE